MNNAERIAELTKLQCQVDRIRADLGISPPGSILYQTCRDDLIVVQADGFGRATTSLVEGNYPVDYCTKFERQFPTEQEAESAAEAVATGRLSPSVALGAAP